MLGRSGFDGRACRIGTRLDGAKITAYGLQSLALSLNLVTVADTEASQDRDGRPHAHAVRT
jgi:hypothetical protein